MATSTKKATGGLGRGLAALIPTAPPAEAAPPPLPPAPVTGPREIPVAAIRRNPYQPRGRFEIEELRQLSESVAQHGVLQPVVVTEVDGGFQLIAGERRTRAAELAGLATIPAVVRTAGEQEQLALALVENLQRSDLNAMDEARAFKQLMDEFGLTQEDVARRVGRTRPAITNTLRLLQVSPEVQDAVEDRRISEGHARALASLDDHAAQDLALGLVEERSLSVRQTEQLVREVAAGSKLQRAARATAPDPDVERLESELRDSLGTKVSLIPGRRGGRITITWYDEDDLTRLVERLVGGHR
ncbi:MAG: ParB/RepB/Spo0J family partition protein [Chloroflexota bacterium]